MPLLQALCDKTERILLACVLVFAGIWPGIATGQGEGQERLFIDYSARPKLARLKAPALCIVDPHSKADLKTAHERGHRLLAYISVVELAKGSPADAAAQKHGVPYVGSNPDWNSQLMDLSSSVWMSFLVDDCAAKAAGAGFDGFFLDTIDSIERLAGKDASRLAACQSALIKLVQTLDQRFPRAQIVVNRGFDLLPRLKDHIDGLLVESVYCGFEPATKRYRAVDPAGSAWVEGKIRAAQALKIPVYAVDYLPMAKREQAQAAAERLKVLGCVPLVTTHDLTGEVLAPLN